MNSVKKYLTLFIVIASSRPVNKNVSTVQTLLAYVSAKPGTELDVHKLLANYQTGFCYKFRPAWLPSAQIK